MKVLNSLNNIAMTNDMVNKITQIYRFKGKDFYYKEVMKLEKSKIENQVIEQDVFFLSKLLELGITDQRMKLILKNKSQPKNNSEEIAVNLVKMFNVIQTNKIENFELLANSIVDLHKLIISKNKRVKFSSTTNQDIQIGLTDKHSSSKKMILEDLLLGYNKLISKDSHEDVLLLTGLLVDFINIKPFNDNNDIVGLITFYTMLFKFEFGVFRYVSFFELVFRYKNELDNSIHQAGFNWTQGFPQIIGLYVYLLDFILTGYKEVEKIVSDYKFDADLNKSDNVENSILKMNQTFTKDDVRRQHPYVSDSTINRTLKRLKNEGKVKPLGTGRSAKWIKEKIDEEQIIFDFN